MANEEQEFVRLAYLEMGQGYIDLQDISGSLRETTAAMITDCKGLYDSVRRTPLGATAQTAPRPRQPLTK